MADEMKKDGMADPAHTLPAGKNTLMAILAYIGPLVIISYFVAKDDSFVKYHVRQGIVLFAIEVVLWVIRSTFWMFLPIFFIWNIINLAILILAIIGIVNAARGEEKPLPLVGGLAKYFPI